MNSIKQTDLSELDTNLEEKRDIEQEFIWNQLPSEQHKWYACFTEFRLSGLNRRVIDVLNAERRRVGKKNIKRISGAWQRQVNVYKWWERAEAYDKWLLAEKEKAYKEQFTAMRDDILGVVGKLIDKSKKMLEFPVAQVVKQERDEEGRVIEITTIIPARWDFRDVATIARTSSDLLDSIEGVARKIDVNTEQVVKFDLTGLPSSILTALLSEIEQGEAKDFNQTGTSIKKPD